MPLGAPQRFVVDTQHVSGLTLNPREPISG